MSYVFTYMYVLEKVLLEARRMSRYHTHKDAPSRPHRSRYTALPARHPSRHMLLVTISTSVLKDAGQGGPHVEIDAVGTGHHCGCGNATCVVLRVGLFSRTYIYV